MSDCKIGPTDTPYYVSYQLYEINMIVPGVCILCSFSCHTLNCWRL